MTVPSEEGLPRAPRFRPIVLRIASWLGLTALALEFVRSTPLLKIVPQPFQHAILFHGKPALAYVAFACLTLFLGLKDQARVTGG